MNVTKAKMASRDEVGSRFNLQWPAHNLHVYRQDYPALLLVIYNLQNWKITLRESGNQDEVSFTV